MGELLLRLFTLASPYCTRQLLFPCCYYRTAVSAKIVSLAAHKMLQYLLSRPVRIHTRRGLQTKRRKWLWYFMRVQGYKWTFVWRSPSGKTLTLARHLAVKIRRHVKVTLDKSQFLLLTVISPTGRNVWEGLLYRRPSLDYSENKRAAVNIVCSQSCSRII